MNWEVIREINFVILFIAFCLMCYKGTLAMVLQTEKFIPGRFMNMVWTVLALYSIGEVLFQGTSGGFRVLLQTIVAIGQLVIVIFFHKVHKCEDCSSEMAD